MVGYQDEDAVIDGGSAFRIFVTLLITVRRYLTCTNYFTNFTSMR